MSIQDYFNRKEQKRASENISLICLQEKHRRIRSQVSKMLGDRQ